MSAELSQKCIKTMQKRLFCFYKIIILSERERIIYFYFKLLILFLRKLLSTVKNLNLSEHFLFVASDSWGTKKESIHSFDSVAEGTITFAPKSFHIRGDY